jgi:hypothetical protein
MPGPVDDLDHSDSFVPALGHKLGIDATRKTAAEGYNRVWPPDIRMDEATRELVSARWREYGLGAVAPHADVWSGQGAAALRALLAAAGYVQDSIDPATLRAQGVHLPETSP